MIKINQRDVVELRGGVPGQSWVYLTPPGEMTIKDSEGKVKTIDLTPDYWQKVASETQRALEDMKRRAVGGATPYTFPVTREHIKIGRREGDIIATRYGTAKGRTGLWGLVDWTPGTWSDIRRGSIKHVSLGVAPKWTSDAGVTYGPLLWEMAITTHPVNKQIGTIQDTLTLRWAESGATSMTPEELQAMLDAFKALLDQQHAAILADVKMLMNPDEEIEPEPEPEPELEEADDAGDAPEADPEEAAQDAADKMELEQSDRIAALERQIEMLAKGKGLNFSEHSATASPTRGGGQGKKTVADVKKQTGLSGVQAIAQWRKDTVGK